MFKFVAAVSLDLGQTGLPRYLSVLLQPLLREMMDNSPTAGRPSNVQYSRRERAPMSFTSITKNNYRYSGGGGLSKDIVVKGHLSIVIRMPLILPLSKGHLSNEDRLIWSKVCLYWRRTTV